MCQLLPLLSHPPLIHVGFWQFSTIRGTSNIHLEEGFGEKFITGSITYNWRSPPREKLAKTVGQLEHNKLKEGEGGGSCAYVTWFEVFNVHIGYKELQIEQSFGLPCWSTLPIKAMLKKERKSAKYLRILHHIPHCQPYWIGFSFTSYHKKNRSVRIYVKTIVVEVPLLPRFGVRVIEVIKPLCKPVRFWKIFDICVAVTFRSYQHPSTRSSTKKMKRTERDFGECKTKNCQMEQEAQ